VEIGTYSNAGYVIASLMMEKASSQTFEKLVKGNLTKMKLDCFFGFPNQESEDNPWGHWEQFGQFISLNPQHPYKLEDFMLSAGDISMNILDYSRFIQIHLRGLNGRDDQLTKKDFEELHYKFNGYAYGWGNSNINSKPVSFHDGSTGTFYCHTIIIPSIDLAVVVMTNSAKEKHIEAIYKLRELIVSNQNTLR
jgi:CubicO group peptidase (beta-lactamase class C family)